MPNAGGARGRGGHDQTVGKEGQGELCPRTGPSIAARPDRRSVTFELREGGGVGSCTINVTQFDGTAVAGTYSGTLWNSYTAMHREITYSGAFRIPRTPPP